MNFKYRGGYWGALALLLVASLAQAQTPAAAPAPAAPSANPAAAPAAPAAQNPVITNQPASLPAPAQPAADGADAAAPAEQGADAAQAFAAPPAERNEFQEFIARSTGQPLPVFGHDLFRGPSTFAPLERIPVPADYVIGPGDEIVIRAWGQIDVDYRAVVDRDGRIHIPKVGAVIVSGLAYQDLDGLIRRAVGRIYKNFELTATLGQLRSVQIFVVGQARRPGTYVVSSLSTLVNALFDSGGPSIKGSMRKIQLKRGNKLVTEFDLYDLLLKGDKSRDAKLLPGDVIFIPPVGPLAAIAGSVNTPAIYELREKSTLDDLIATAGGLTTTASGQKVLLERIDNRTTRTVDEFALDRAGRARAVKDGDLVRVLSLSPRFDNAVTLQGNVAAPARYPWREGMRVTDLLRDNHDLLTSAFYERQNRGSLTDRAKAREVNWDFAVIQRLETATLTTRLHPFNLGKAILGDARENVPLQAGDIVTVYAAGEALPRTEADVALQGSLLGMPARRFAWREGIRLTDIIPDARWLIDYYDYWNNLEGSGLRSEINWDFANIVRLDPATLAKTTLAFDLGKAVLEKNAAHDPLLLPGDEITIFARDEMAVPIERQGKYVRIEGEVPAAGVYRVQPGETLRQLVMRLGGLTDNAYLYGAEFTRESTRAQQQKRLDEALDRLEAEAARVSASESQGVISQEQADSLGQQVQSRQALIAKLRQIRATGRIVLELPRNGAAVKNIPDLVLEDGDRFYVPPLPSTVSVFGSVYNQNAFIYRSGKDVGDYLAQAGGPTRDADKGSIYLVKADGSVVSKRQSGSFFNGFDGQRVMPGDAIVVPEDLEKFRWTRELKDWSQIFYQFALGVAGLKVLSDL